ncbi:hypothetical protein [Streptomyces sp. NK15101]|uniref:hypothetical protein n=1 Tax=Streptomyces sp. NK15101 TaxID=2873261 RepID=UPI001CEC657D|nr:hypothetical protein [Streptomyces sp. NK15101]
MAEVTNEELSIQIAGLGHKLRIVDGGWLPSTNWLREHLIVPDFKTKFEEMYQELHKEKSSELLEAFGLDGLGAAVEKFHEGHEAKVEYLLAAVSGIAVPMIIGGLVIAFRRIILEGFRAVQIALTGKAFVLNENQNGFERLTRDQIREREANAGGGIASIPRDANFDALRGQLEAINPHLREFNTQAGPFKTAFRQMPKASAMVKTADGITRIKNAITGAVPTDITALAKALGKLTGAVKHHDPKKMPDPRKIEKLNLAMADADPDKITAVAKATGKLASAQRHFDPKKLPKARGLESAARAAERLADAGRDVAQAFNTLKIKAQEAAQVMA